MAGPVIETNGKPPKFYREKPLKSTISSHAGSSYFLGPELPLSYIARHGSQLPHQFPEPELSSSAGDEMAPQTVEARVLHLFSILTTRDFHLQTVGVCCTSYAEHDALGPTVPWNLAPKQVGYQRPVSRGGRSLRVCRTMSQSPLRLVGLECHKQSDLSPYHDHHCWVTGSVQGAS
jgi:hypothetical protein